MERDDKREEIVANAWRDIVASWHYTYRSFVSYVLEAALVRHRPHARSGMGRWGESLAYRWNRFLNGAGWFAVRVAMRQGILLSHH